VNAVLISIVVFASTFAGALAGIRSRKRLPSHRLNDESKHVVQLCMGLIATLTALVLGLVTASAKEAFDAQGRAMHSVAAGILVLDRTLERFGSEAQPIRDEIRAAIHHRLARDWFVGEPIEVQHPTEGIRTPDEIEEAILGLEAVDARETFLKGQALEAAVDVLKTRWLALAGAGAAGPGPFLVVIVFWLTALFWSFGLVAPGDRTVMGVLLLSATSVAASVFLILEMQTPFSGLLKVSRAPLHYVLEHLAK
jgi:hypothetical protein